MINSESSIDIERFEEPWNHHTESYLTGVAANCRNSSTKHSKAGYYYKKRSEWIILPSIIFSLAMSPIAAILELVGSQFTNYISSVGFLAVGVLTALAKYYRLEAQQIDNFNFEQRYASLGTDIESELLKSKRYRVQSDVFTAKIISSYDHLNSQAPVLPAHIKLNREI